MNGKFYICSKISTLCFT